MLAYAITMHDTAVRKGILSGQIAMCTLHTFPFQSEYTTVEGDMQVVEELVLTEIPVEQATQRLSKLRIRALQGTWGRTVQERH